MGGSISQVLRMIDQISSSDGADQKIENAFYKHSVSNRTSTRVGNFVPLFLQHSVSRMQVTEKTGNDQLPLASAFCWKC